MPKAAVASEQLRRKLAAVTNSQDSIMATSQWILKQSKNLDEILDCWEAQISKSDHEHRLTLLYLANDVVQNCRKRHPELVGELYANLYHFMLFEMFGSFESNQRSKTWPITRFEVALKKYWMSGQREQSSRRKKWKSCEKFWTMSNPHIKVVSLHGGGLTIFVDKAERALQDFKPQDLAEALKEYSR